RRFTITEHRSERDDSVLMRLSETVPAGDLAEIAELLERSLASSGVPEGPALEWTRLVDGGRGHFPSAGVAHAGRRDAYSPLRNRQRGWPAGSSMMRMRSRLRLGGCHGASLPPASIVVATAASRSSTS